MAAVVETVRLLLALNANDGGKTAFQMAKTDEIKLLFLDHEKKSVKKQREIVFVFKK